MREAEETTRQRVAALLRKEPFTPSELGARLDLTPETVVRHLEHVSLTLERTDEQVLVAPPTCRDCEFDSFDDLLNLPSRCPSCKSETISEPTYVIE